MRRPLVGIIMGSRSDWETVQHCTHLLEKLDVPFEARVLSAHRTPEETADYCRTAEARGLRVLVAAAGGAAHLAGVAAALTHLPVLGIPILGKNLGGMDSLLSMVQMPSGIPVATFAIGSAGAANAALFAGAILSLQDEALRERLLAFRQAQREKVLAEPPLV